MATAPYWFGKSGDRGALEYIIIISYISLFPKKFAFCLLISIFHLKKHIKGSNKQQKYEKVEYIKYYQ